MLKYLMLGRSGLVPRKGRDEHGITGFGDAHSSEEWAAFDRALHCGLKLAKKGPSLRLVSGS